MTDGFNVTAEIWAACYSVAAEHLHDVATVLYGSTVTRLCAVRAIGMAWALGATRPSGSTIAPEPSLEAISARWASDDPLVAQAAQIEPIRFLRPWDEGKLAAIDARRLNESRN